MKRVLFVVITILLLSLNSYAQNVPQLINYQGKLTDSNGNPLATAEYEMSFSIYSEKTGGLSVWGPQEFKDTNKVTVAKGFFNVILGPVDSTDRKIEEAFESPNAYLEITVNGQTILPRQQVLSTSYALQALKAKYPVLGVTPVGSVITWTTQSAPEGYLECNGQSLSKNDYPELFAVIGYTYGGEGDKFNLPDYRGYFLRGWSHDTSRDPDKDQRKDKDGNTVGNIVGSVQDEEVKKHSHSTVQMISNNNIDGVDSTTRYSGEHHNENRQTGEIGGSETRPKNLTVMYCIKYKKYNE